MASPSSLLIRRARIILPNGEWMVGDVLTRDRIITEVAPQISTAEPTIEIDASGLTLLPGVIDPQVHFREPGLEYKENLFTASCACAKGGVTSFLEMPNTRPLTTTQQTLDDKLQRASQKCLVNYGFFIGATSENLADILSVSPTPGIKIFMGSMHGSVVGGY
jgi:dihydroorotase